MEIGVGLVALALTTAAHGHQCPGFSRPVVSPDRRWAIECRPKADDAVDSEHRLLLKDARAARTVLLRSFGRWAAVLWSPDGGSLAVTDGLGSNATESFVYDPQHPDSPTDVRDLLNGQIESRRLTFLEGKDHVYVEAEKWLDKTHLRVRVWGHGDRESFDRQFTVVVSAVVRD